MTLELPEISAIRRFSADDLRLELACALYARSRISAVSGADLSGCDLVTFQAALREREIPRQYSEDDLAADMDVLAKLFPA
jgi:predicted HTH domain antitoxin